MDRNPNPGQSSGEAPEFLASRHDARLESRQYPVNEFYQQFAVTGMLSASDSLFVTDQDNRLGDHQDFPMDDHVRNEYELPGFALPSVAYPSVNFQMSMDSTAMNNVFQLPSQRMDGGYHPSGHPAASTRDPFSSGLNDTHNAVTNVHADSPHSSTVPANSPPLNSSSPVLQSNRPGSQQPGMSVWNPAGENAPISSNRTRRKMTNFELVRNRALKAAGGACETCRRRKKKV